jgi:hypothetical protein
MLSESPNTWNNWSVGSSRELQHADGCIFIAKDREPRTGEACYRTTGHSKGKLVSRIAWATALTLKQHEKSTSGLVTRIRANTKRYIQLFSETVDDVMPNPTKDISHHDDVLDVIIHQRREKNLANGQDGQNLFPPMLTRR